MQLTQVKVDKAGVGRPKATIETIRAKAHVSVTNVEGGVRIRVSRNLTPVAQFVAKGQTTADREAIIAFVRKEYIATGKLDEALNNYRTIEKERKAAREAAKK